MTNGNFNIDIGNKGAASDSNTIRIGDPANQTATYIAGINGVALTGSAVIVDSNGQLGIQASSIKYKDDVRDIGDNDQKLMHLRPVSFRYKGSDVQQFGLTAEEVDKVYPDLVARDANGEPISVQYHELPALLLNEIQKQHREIDAQRTEVVRQQKLIEDQKALMRLMERRLTSLEKLVEVSH